MSGELNGVHFIQKVEDLDEFPLRPIADNVPLDADISVFIGRTTKKFYGLKIMKGNQRQDIWFSDVERIKQIIDRMLGT